MSCFSGFLNCLMPDRRDKMAAQIEISTPCNLITAPPPRMSTPPARYASTRKHSVRKESISSPISPPPTYTPFGAGPQASTYANTTRMVGDKPAYYAYAYSQPTTPGSTASRRSLMKRESPVVHQEKQQHHQQEEVSSPAAPKTSVEMNLDTTPRAARAFDYICSPFRSKKTVATERLEFEPAVRKSDEQEERVAKMPRKSHRFTRRFTMRSSSVAGHHGRVSPFVAPSKNSSTSSFRRQQRHRREASIEKAFHERNQFHRQQQQEQQQEQQEQIQQVQEQQQRRQASSRREPPNRIKNGGEGVGLTAVRGGPREHQSGAALPWTAPVVGRADVASILAPPTAEQIAEMERFVGEEERQMRLRSSPDTETDDELDDADRITYAELHYPHHQSVRSFDKYC